MHLGLDLLDVSVGGVTAGLPLIVEADQGAGRNALFLQIVEGALGRGEQVVFLAAEPPSILLHQAAAMGIDLETPLREERLILLEMESAAPRLMRTSGTDALLAAIRETAPRATFLALNPLTALTGEILDEAQLRDVARSFYAEWEQSHLVLGVESDQLDRSAGLRRVLLETCGAYVSVKRKYGPHFTLSVERLRVGDLPEEPLTFRLASTGAVLTASPGSTAPATEPATTTERPAPAKSAAVPDVEAPRSVAKTPDVEPAPPAPAPRARPAGSKPSILVIDHDPDARAEYREWLGDAHEIRTAPDGSEGLALLMESRPDLVVLDLDLPSVTGFDVLRAVGRSRDWIPVVVISSRIRRPLDRVRPFLLGASDVIAKPPDRFDLVRKVDSLINATRPPPEYEDFAVLRHDGGGSVVDEASLRERCDGAARLVRRFDLASSLVALEAPSSELLDSVVAIGDDELRMEDSLCAVGDRRALILLLGAPRAGAETSAARLCEAIEQRGVDISELRVAIHALEASTDPGDWSDYFKDLAPWCDLSSS